MAGEFFGNNGISENNVRPCSYVLITLSDINGIQVKANISNTTSKKVVAHLMANKQAVIDSVKGAIVKDLLEKNLGDYLSECIDELHKAVEIPYVQPINVGILE